MSNREEFLFDICVATDHETELVTQNFGGDRMNVMEDLFYGNINLNEKCYNHDSEYARFAKIVADNEERITTFLNSLSKAEEEQRLFLQMVNAQSEISEFLEFERFVEGFRMGASLILEIFVIPKQSVMRDIS